MKGNAFRIYAEYYDQIYLMTKKLSKGIDNFMKAFSDYEVEHVVAHLEVRPTKIKGRLQIKIRKVESI